MKTKMKLKASLKIWVVIYPAITVFLYALGGAMAGLPLYIRTLIITISLVPFIVFIGLPVVDKLAALLVQASKQKGLSNG